LTLSGEGVIKCYTMNILKQLEIYRLENKITQAQLATELGVSFATVNRWLNDRTRPSKIQQYHIEKFLDTRVYYAKRSKGKN